MLKTLLTVCITLFSCVMVPLAAAQSGTAQSESPSASGKPVPKSAVFSQKEFEPGTYELAGRLSLRRQYLGSRSTPAFQDIVQFNFFDGSELRFLTFEDSELSKELTQKLIKNYSLPASISTQLDVKTVGHDGINMSQRISGKISDCKIHSVKAMCEAAQASGSTEAQIEQFKSAIAPEAKGSNVMASMGQVFVRSKPSRRGSGLSIAGINVFNSNEKPVTIKIQKLWAEQDGVKYQYKMAERSGPDSWKVAGQSWADGVYEAGQQPQKLWNFNPNKPIAAKLKITVHLELQIDGGDVLTLTRTVTPQ